MSDFPPGPYRFVTITATAADGSVVTIEIPTEVELVIETARPRETFDLSLPRRYDPAPFPTTTFTVRQTAKQAEAHSQAGGESIYTVSWGQQGQ